MTLGIVSLRPTFYAVALAAGLGAAAALAQDAEPKLDVIYVPTPQEVVDRMLELAEVKAGDYMIDFGCGDGRMVVTAAKRGARGYGVDINPQRIKEANENAQKAGVTDKVDLQDRQPVRGGPQQGRRDGDVSFDRHQYPAASENPQRHEARHAHRLARLRHGRLGSRSARHSQRQEHLLLGRARQGRRQMADRERRAEAHARDQPEIPEVHRQGRHRRQDRRGQGRPAQGRRDQLHPQRPGV